MSRAVLQFLTALPFLACTTSPSNGELRTPEVVISHDPIAGLVGHWVDSSATDGTVFHEQWRNRGNGDLEGLGFVLSGRDTVFIEYLAILRRDSIVQYSALVPSQGHSQPVYFTLTHDKDSLVFIAPEHDFPQRIVYTPTDGRGWSVRVSGTLRGLHQEERFSLKPREERTQRSLP